MRILGALLAMGVLLVGAHMAQPKAEAFHWQPQFYTVCYNGHELITTWPSYYINRYGATLGPCP